MGDIQSLRSNGVLHPHGAPHNGNNAPALNAESIENQLARILNSQALSGSIRLKDFLEFTIRQHLSGNGDALKEYSLALEVFRKPASYDPAVDSTVRSAAVRLRAKLRTYYETEGRNDPILIEYPGGHYAPRFSLRTQPGDAVYGNGSASTATVPRKAATPRAWRWGAALAAFILGLLIATLVYRWVFRTAAPSLQPQRKSVVVFGLQNLSGSSGSAWLSVALAELLRDELSAGERIRTISGAETATAKKELDLRDVESLSKESLTQLGRNLGVDLVVTGSYIEVGSGDIRLDIHLQDAKAGETIATVSRSGTEGKLFDLVSTAGTELRARLGVQAATGAESAGVRASMPSNQGAMQMYAEGLEKLRRFEATDARDLLLKAAAMEPAYPLAHSALAEAWSALGYGENARIEAGKAHDLAKGLPREEFWLVEGRYREMNKEWDEAIAAYKKLWAFHPDNLDYGLLLAAAQTSSGKGAAALATVAELRTLCGTGVAGPPDARIELAEASAHSSLSEYPQELSAARQAVAIGSDRRAYLVVAQARMAEGSALRGIGNVSQATVAFDKAKTLFDGVGDKRGKADALEALGSVINEQVDPAAAKKSYEEAAAIYREIGDKAGLRRTLNDLGVWQKNQGNPKAARKLYDESVAISRDIGDRRGEGIGLFNTALFLWNDPGTGPLPLYRKALGIFEEVGYKDGQVHVLNEMGVWADDRGNLLDALAYFDKNLALSREMGSQGGQAFALGNRADVLFNLGRLTDAKKSLEDAIAIDSALNLPGGAVGLRNGLAKVLYHMGDFRAARSEFAGVGEFLLRQSDRSKASNDPQYQATVSRLGLAALDLEDGRFVEVESTLRGIAGKYATERDGEAGVLASIALAKCLLRERKYKESQAAIDRAELLRRSLKTDAWPELAREIAIVRARALAGRGDSAGALRSLRAVIAEAKSQGFYGFELQARLAAGEVELKSGRRTAVRQELLALADEARVRGFGLIARAAGQAGRPVLH